MVCLALMACLTMQHADAQYLKRLPKDSTSNSATHYTGFNFTPDGVTSISVSNDKPASGGGTLSGYQVLEHRVDTTLNIWEKVPGSDTLTLTDGDNGHIWPISTQAGNGYRVKTVTSGTMKFYIYVAYLRRQIR